MVGDDWAWDVVQPGRVGIPAYWIADPATERPDPDPVPLGQGSLGDFLAWIRKPGTRTDFRPPF
jgi:hypothetical protein